MSGPPGLGSARFALSATIAYNLQRTANFFCDMDSKKKGGSAATPFPTLLLPFTLRKRVHGAVDMAIERAEAFDLLGTMTTLLGPALKPGDQAPAFALVSNDLSPVTLERFRGKPLLISVVPSLDTSVCSIQTNTFDKEAADMGDKASFITVSADLPFAQKRWCGTNNAINGQTLSDYFDMSFGLAYGTYIKEVRLESRAVFVVDGEGTIRYVEYVPGAIQEPNYGEALTALRGLLS